jgi:N-acetylmuramoyl-L-alanine amidase
MSPTFDDRPGAIDMLVLHYTGMKTAAAAIERLCDPAAKVSSHYVVEEDGNVVQLVEEQKRAWHAGISYWRGRRGLNDVSVGIEIVNPGHEWGYRAFPLKQMAAVRDLCQAIIFRHGISATNVVGHSDIAPNGVGVWTDEFAASADVAADLTAIGYDMALPWRDVVTAFQRHFLPDTVTGTACPRTAGRAAAVARLMGQR